MKTLKTLIPLFVAFYFLSCERTPEDRLPGEWSIATEVSTDVLYNGQTSSESNTDAGMAVFEKDGLGYITLSDNVTDTITYMEKGDSIFFTWDGETTGYSVIENSRSRQEYERVISESGDNYNFTTTSSIILTN